MVTEFQFPDVGEGITEGRIKKWLVNEGETVEEDQTLAQVETDKAVVDMPSPADGTIIEILVPEGEKVKVGQVMVTIGGDGDDKPAPNEKPSMEKPSPKEAPGEKQVESPSGKKVFALPKVRKMARENNIDLSMVTGSGPKGRVTEKDLEDLLGSREEPKPAPVKEKKKPMRIKLNYDFYGHISYVDYKGLREVIGNRLTTSKFTAPHAAAMDEVDVTELWDLRKGMNEELKEKGEKLTFTPFIVKAVDRKSVV